MTIPNASISAEPLARIIISPPAQFRGLFAGLIRKLHETGSKIVVVSPNPQREDYWTHALAGCDRVEFAICDHRYRVARETVSGKTEVIERARAYERQLGVTINHLSVADRHMGRGYALGGYYHARSQISEKSSYIQMVAAFVAELDFWSSLIDRVRPTLLVNCNEVAWRIATTHGVGFRVLAGSRYKSLYQWAHTPRYENPFIEAAYRSLLGRDFPAVALLEPYSAHNDIVGRFAKTMRAPAILRSNIYRTVQHGYWNLRGYEKAKGYYLKEDIASPWRTRKAFRKMRGRDTVRLDALKGQPFVYYPLHTEPEVALQGLSPEYTFQLETILRVARLLPAGVMLAVKDTQSALGRRPRDFYGQILELKNVVLLDIEERGVDVVTACAAVVTITGTAGFEASIVGKPVISFGARNQYNILPHVHYVTNEALLRAAVDAVLNHHDPVRAAADGARFLEAIKQQSFNLEGFDFMRPEVVEEQMIDVILRSLIASVVGGENRVET